MWVYRLTQDFRTEGLVASLAAVSILGWMVRHWLGWTYVAIAGLAIGSLYRSAPPIASGEWAPYVNDTRRYIPAMPDSHARLK